MSVAELRSLKQSRAEMDRLVSKASSLETKIKEKADWTVRVSLANDVKLAAASFVAAFDGLVHTYLPDMEASTKTLFHGLAVSTSEVDSAAKNRIEFAEGMAMVLKRLNGAVRDCDGLLALLETEVRAASDSASSPPSPTPTPTPAHKPETQLPRIVVFLGAGMSKPLGIPTSADFFADKCFERFDNAKSYLALCDSLKVSPESADLERILRATEPVATRTRTSGLPPSSEDDTLAALDSEIRSTIYEKCTSFDKKRCMALLGNLFGNLTERHVAELSVFTTNYDRTVEYFFAQRVRTWMRAQHAVSWKLVPRLRDGFVRGDSGGLVWREWGYRALDDEPSGGCNSPLYVKMHGSVGWFDAGKYVVELSPELVRSTGLSPVFVTPGFKGLPDHLIFRTGRRMLEEKLNDADSALVIGFSFRDDYIAEIFEKAVIHNGKLSITAINPTDWPADSKVLTYSRLAKKIEQYQCCFGESNDHSWTESVRVTPNPWRVVPFTINGHLAAKS